MPLLGKFGGPDVNAFYEAGTLNGPWPGDTLLAVRSNNAWVPWFETSLLHGSSTRGGGASGAPSAGQHVAPPHGAARSALGGLLERISPGTKVVTIMPANGFCGPSSMQRAFQNQPAGYIGSPDVVWGAMCTTMGRDAACKMIRELSVPTMTSSDNYLDPIDITSTFARLFGAAVCIRADSHYSSIPSEQYVALSCVLCQYTDGDLIMVDLERSDDYTPTQLLSGRMPMFVLFTASVHTNPPKGKKRPPEADEPTFHDLKGQHIEPIVSAPLPFSGLVVHDTVDIHTTSVCWPLAAWITLAGVVDEVVVDEVE